MSTILIHKFVPRSWSSTDKKILNAACLIGLLTVFVKTIAALKELYVAYHFGTANAVDAFLIAYVLLAFFINVIGSSVNAAMIPTYIQVLKHESEESAHILLSSVMWLTIILLIVVSLIILASVKPILPFIGSGFGEKKLLLTYSLFFVMLPIVVLNGISTVLGAVLNAVENFSLPAVVPCLIPTFIIILLYIEGATIGIYALAIGTVLGTVLEVVVLFFALKRRKIRVFSFQFKYTKHLKNVFYQFLPMVIGALVAYSSTLIDQSMAAMLGSGSVAQIGYANRLISLPLTLAVTALGTSIIPYASQMVANKEWKALNKTLSNYLKMITIFSVPIAIIVILAAPLLVSLIYQRGAFTLTDTQIVSKVLIYFALQIPFYIASIFVVRLITAMKKNQILMFGATIILTTNVTLNYLFMQILGVAGIALSTSVTYIVAFIFYFSALKFLMYKNYKQDYSIKAVTD